VSVDATRWAWQQPLKGTKKLVLLALADYAGEECEAWPYVETIAGRVGVSKRATRDALHELEEEGYLHRRVHPSRRANLYVLRVRWAAAEAEADRRPIGTTNEPPVGGKTPPTPSEDVERVWATYVECMEPRSADLDAEGRKLILAALKVADADECCNAILGCKASAFHMGDNDRRRKYNRLSQILKGKQGGKTTREQIDMFLGIAERAGVQSDGTSADPAIVSQRKREVLDAFEFPGDDVVVRRGEESERWLAEHGWVVEHEDSGRPLFRRAL
jgi:DNA-binding MarR family transcriptional regulator